MQKLTRRGIASFGVAALLALAPITATAAHADDEVVVAEAPVDVAAEAPAELVAETPAEAVAEVPTEVIADASTEIAAEDAPETPAETVAAASAQRSVLESEAAPEARVASSLAAGAAGYSPVIDYSEGAAITVSIVGITLTASWKATSAGNTYGYYFVLADLDGGSTVVRTTGRGTEFTANIIPGHSYEVYFDDRVQVFGRMYITTSLLPAPNAPTELTATRLPTADGLSLAWEAPAENAGNVQNPVTGYNIDVLSNKTLTNYTTDTLSLTLPELSVGDVYNFTVTAIGADGQLSAIATADTTLEAIAPTAVQNVSLARTGGVLTASWEEPTYNGGSEVGSYDIVFRADGTLVKSYTATTAGSLVLDTPAGYETDYTVDVTGTNAAGLTSIVFTSNSVRRPAVTPTTLAVTAERLTTSSAYTVSWTESTAGDSPITGYTVRLYNTDDDSFISSVTASPATRSTNLAVPSTITSGSGLRFEVVSTAENALSSVTGYKYETFAAVAPSAVRDLELIRVGDDLVASWDAPAYDGGFGITRYDVVLYADGAMQSQDAATDGNTSLVMVDAAKYSIKYKVEVTAVGDGYIPGPSSESYPIERANFAPTTPTSFGSPYGYKEPLVYASWNFAPQEGSAVESVTVTLYNADGSIAKQEKVSNGDPGTTFDGLTNDTIYSVGVVATNAAGSSTESARTEVRTNAAVPPAATAEEVVAEGNRNNVTASLTGTELVAHLDGVGEGDWVFGYAYSTPSSLGWTQVDANGFARWSIAGAVLATGATHTLAVQNNVGAQLGFATFTIAADASTAALAHTGSDADTVLLLAAGMLALGAVLMVRRRVRTAL